MVCGFDSRPSHGEIIRVFALSNPGDRKRGTVAAPTVPRFFDLVGARSSEGRPRSSASLATKNPAPSPVAGFVFAFELVATLGRAALYTCKASKASEERRQRP